MITSSYRPGPWFGVFGSATTLLVPGSEKEHVAALWARIDDGAGFDEVLDLLLAPGLTALTGFVLLGTDDTTTLLLVRGPVLVTGAADGEPVRVDGRDARTWVERSLDAVESLQHRRRPDRTTTTATSRPPRRPRGPADRHRAGARRSRRPAGAPRRRPAPSSERRTRSSRPPSTTRPTPPGSTTPVRSTSRVPPPLLPTVAPPVASVVSAADPPAAADHDGLTAVGAPEADPAWSGLPDLPEEPPAPGVAPVARLLISNGEVVEVDRAILIGRAPEARRFTSTDQPRLVRVPSPLHEISSTHVEVRPGSGADHGSAVVTDMGSTNGTVIDQPGLGPESLKPGIAVQLIPGATINLGDGVTIQVARP